MIDRIAFCKHRPIDLEVNVARAWVIVVPFIFSASKLILNSKEYILPNNLTLVKLFCSW